MDSIIAQTNSQWHGKQILLWSKEEKNACTWTVQISIEWKYKPFATTTIENEMKAAVKSNYNWRTHNRCRMRGKIFRMETRNFSNNRQEDEANKKNENETEQKKYAEKL